MEKESSFKDGESSLPRDRSKISSIDTVDTAIYAPALTSERSKGTSFGASVHEALHTPDYSRTEDAVSRTKSIHSLEADLPPRSPNFADLDVRPGQLPQRGGIIHIPARTRWVSRLFTQRVKVCERG